jgi:hypothetical protein
MPRLGENARAGLAPAAKLAVDIASWTVGGTLAGVAWARGGRPVHPHGAVHRARLVVEGARHAPAASRLIATEAEHAALVRFSRSLGLPRPFPDLLGLSLRVMGAYG